MSPESLNGSGPSGSPRPSVLIVDDDPTYRATMAALLMDAGLAPLEAATGVEALQIIDTHDVDAMLVDQKMPGMSGLELAGRLRASGERSVVPIWFVSADDSPELRVQALQAGATDFVLKPFDPLELIARMHAQLRLAAHWDRKIRDLRARAATVTAIASLPSGRRVSQSGAAICELIQDNHPGSSVAIFSWNELHSTVEVLASCGAPDLADERKRLSKPRWDAQPVIYYSPDQPARWYACAPIRLGRSSVGLLMIEDRRSSQDDLLSAATDYSVVSGLQMGPLLVLDRRAARSRRAVETVLRQRSFESLFQPVIDLRDDTVVGYEALTRLRNGKPILGLLKDADTAQIRPECEIALLEASLTEATALTDRPWLSINLSPSVLLKRTVELAEMLSAVDREVVIELTENEQIEDYPPVMDAVCRLGDRVKLAVDDTGSGYASLKHVVTLRPQYLKLDRSWVTGLQDDDTRQALIHGIVAFCEQTHTQLIAEGIETEAELEALRKLEVPFGQGYLLGRPVPLPTLPARAD